MNKFQWVGVKGSSPLQKFLYLVVFQQLAQNFSSGQVRQRLTNLLLAIGLVSSCFAPFPAAAREPHCPTELEPLVESMLPELPGYINRELQRSRPTTLGLSPHPDDPNAFSSIILAGQPEFEPLPPGTARSAIGIEENPDEAVVQAFITTLERTYIHNEILEFQGYHWLFMTPTASGWRLVLMFSSWGSYPADGKTTPPQDSSNSAVGQGVRKWLRDCRYSANPE